MADWVKEGREHSCPACKTEVLEQSDEHSACLWNCSKCGGAFIGREELFHYVQGVTQSRSVAMEFWSLLKAAVAEDEPDGSNLRACAVCSTALERFGFGEHPMVIADRCPNEHGLWLDDGDLEKVVRCARAVAAVEGRESVDAQRGEVQTAHPTPEGPLVCPNCRQRFPETDADARCNDCNVPLFRA